MSEAAGTMPFDNATLKAIEAKLGRPLRVLHIGNIANNAYNNARIQRQYGIEANVLSYDYYHVMSTPEWEDAEFTGAVDADAPNWWGTSLKGWKRPDWFVQGPASGCLQYLRARHLGLGKLQKLLWRYLEARCLGYVRFVSKTNGRPIPRMPLHLGLALKAAESYGVANGPSLKMGDTSLTLLRATLLPAHDSGEQAARAAKLSPLLDVDDASPPPGLAQRVLRKTSQLLKGLYRSVLDIYVLPGVRDPALKSTLSEMWLRRRIARGRANREDVLQEVDSNPPGRVQLEEFWTNADARIRYLCAHHTNNVIRYISRIFYFSLKSDVAKINRYNSNIDTKNRDIKFVNSIEKYKNYFKLVSKEDRDAFIEYYSIFGAQMYDVLSLYDVVQAYSVDGCICVINGLDHFISYEHGTLRDLPFENSYYGVVTRLSYHASTQVFVTNSDVLPATKRMGLDPQRVVCLPHAFDDRKLMRFRHENPNLVPPAGPAVIFSPTRQHWKDRSGSWTKGNDVLYRAAALVAAEGHDFRLHLVAWGQEVAESKALLAELGIADKVVWLSTMQKRELWEAYCRAHAVADQFTLPALGGVGFETMALGRRLITAIDAPQLEQFFGEMPPCLAASTIEQCAAQLRLVINDLDDTAERGPAAQQWMRRYHSAERIVDIQARTYARFLAEIQTP
ncbi:MAG: hypothetical protein ACRCWO_01700 [Bosea sp. (in: a-proteobacteria)]